MISRAGQPTYLEGEGGNGCTLRGLVGGCLLFRRKIGARRAFVGDVFEDVEGDVDADAETRGIAREFSGAQSVEGSVLTRSRSSFDATGADLALD